jgi:hypothetical protein
MLSIFYEILNLFYFVFFSFRNFLYRILNFMHMFGKLS